MIKIINTKHSIEANPFKTDVERYWTKNTASPLSVCISRQLRISENIRHKD